MYRYVYSMPPQNRGGTLRVRLLSGASQGVNALEISKKHERYAGRRFNARFA